MLTLFLLFNIVFQVPGRSIDKKKCIQRGKEEVKLMLLTDSIIHI